MAHVESLPLRTSVPSPSSRRRPGRPSPRQACWLAAAAVLVLALAGCLTIPLGDPEQSRADPKFVGTWMQRDPSSGEVKLMDAIAYDARTYLVISYEAKPDGAGSFERGGQSIFKGWLTEVAGQTFCTLQILGEESDQPYVVFRATLADDGRELAARGIEPKFVRENGVDTPEALRKLIEANLDNDSMYVREDRYFKADGPDMEVVREVIGLFR